VRKDTAGRTIIQLAVNDWALDRLLSFDAESAELEDGGDSEPDDDAEEDGPPVVIDLVRPKVIGGGRPDYAGPRPTEGPLVSSCPRPRCPGPQDRIIHLSARRRQAGASS
jgi:hypothetical protein